MADLVASAQEGEAPRQMANVPPPELAGAGQTRLLIKAVEDAVSDLKSDVKDIKSHRHSDFVWLVTVFALGFVALATMIVTSYIRLEDKISALSNTSIRVDTKLEDLLQRIPPVPSQPPRR